MIISVILVFCSFETVFSWTKEKRALERVKLIQRRRIKRSDERYDIFMYSSRILFTLFFVINPRPENSQNFKLYYERHRSYSDVHFLQENGQRFLIHKYFLIALNFKPLQ